MYAIRYYYSSLSKQCFLIVLTIAIAARFALFFAGGFYKEAYVIPSVLLYVAMLLLCAFFFVAFRFTISQFDEEKIVYANRITKKETVVAYRQIQRSRFAKDGIYLYSDPAMEHLLLKVPFRRFGKISPVGVDNFMVMLKNKGIPVDKEYQVLSGYGKSASWYSLGYVILSVVVVFNALPYLVLVILILFTPV